MENCKNCGNNVTDIYCSYCGQKVAVERITFLHIAHNLFHFFTHAEKGFFYTTKQLVLAPGKTIKGYIEGKRIKHQTPVSYFLIWNAIYLLLLLVVEKIFGENKAVNFGEYFGTASATRFAISHLNMALGIILPVQALYFWLVIVYKKYNYFEALVAMLYGIGTLLFWQIVFVIIAVIFYLISGIAMNIQLSDIFKIAYISWFIFDFARMFPVKKKLLRTAMVIILALGTFTLWRMYGFPKVAELFFR